MVALASTEAFSLAASAFSVFLAFFAIWLALQQRRESQSSYNSTQDVLGEMRKVMSSTELLVSENFQSLLGSTVDLQAQMLESLKPRQTVEELYAAMFASLAVEAPENLDKVADVLVKVSGLQALQQ